MFKGISIQLALCRFEMELTNEEYKWQLCSLFCILLLALLSTSSPYSLPLPLSPLSSHSLCILFFSPFPHYPTLLLSFSSSHQTRERKAVLGRKSDAETFCAKRSPTGCWLGRQETHRRKLRPCLNVGMARYDRILYYYLVPVSPR